MSESFWFRFLIFAGLFNLAAGLPMVLAPGFSASTSGIPLPIGDYFFMRFAGMVIALFGVFYVLTAFRPERYRPLLQIGAIAKILTFVMLLIYWLNGTFGFWTFTVGIADLVFALFFLKHLKDYPAR